MRILFASPRFAPQLGGAETWTKAVTGALAARGHELRVVSGAAPGLRAAAPDDGLSVRRAPGGRAGLARAVAGAVRRDRPDVVLAQYSALAPAVVAARAARIPCVAVVHDVYGIAESVRLKGWAGGLARTAGLEQWQRLAPADAYLVPSRATAHRLSRLVRRRPVTVVPAGADHLVTRAAAERSPNHVVFVGRLVPQKGVADLLEAAELLHGRGQPVSVRIIGEGPAGPWLRERARGLNGSVSFAGAVSDAELDAELQRAAALVLPSRREGWGLAVTEAAARGLPYVAYDIPAVREQHERLGGGVLVEARPDALADGIQRLVADPLAAVALGGAALQAAAGMTWAAAGAVVERALEEACGARRDHR